MCELTPRSDQTVLHEPLTMRQALHAVEPLAYVATAGCARIIGWGYDLVAGVADGRLADPYYHATSFAIKYPPIAAVGALYYVCSHESRARNEIYRMDYALRRRLVPELYDVAHYVLTGKSALYVMPSELGIVSTREQNQALIQRQSLSLHDVVDIPFAITEKIIQTGQATVDSVKEVSSTFGRVPEIAPFYARAERLVDAARQHVVPRAERLVRRLYESGKQCLESIAYGMPH